MTNEHKTTSGDTVSILQDGRLEMRIVGDRSSTVFDELQDAYDLARAIDAALIEAHFMPGLPDGVPDEERTQDFSLNVETDFWKRLRATFPEAAAREGPPNTWANNPRYKSETHAGARIRDAAEAMMKDWLAVFGVE